VAVDTAQADGYATDIKQAESHASCAKESCSDNATGEDKEFPEETPRKKPKPDNDHPLLTAMQRRIRNAREKNRSSKICDQFDQIRDTMVSAGVIVPKGTKGTILAAAREYIALLQERQRRVLL
jgi:cysteinyl-tRNA synthetase